LTAKLVCEKIKAMKKNTKEKRWVRLTKGQRSTRQNLYLYHARKRKAWAEFKKTPAGIEVIKRKENAENIARRYLRKWGYTLKDLRPLKSFKVK